MIDTDTDHTMDCLAACQWQGLPPAKAKHDASRGSDFTGPWLLCMNDMVGNFEAMAPVAIRVECCHEGTFVRVWTISTSLLHRLSLRSIDCYLHRATAIPLLLATNSTHTQS